MYSSPESRDGATLVGIEFQGQAFIEWFAHHATQILGAEPGLVVLHEGVKEAVVAGEDGGIEIGKRRALRMHWHGVISVLAWKVATNPPTGWVADRAAFEVGTLPSQNGSRKARATRPAIMQN